MNLRQLQVFQAVCQKQSFTRAAAALYMTQPAVSHVIADLERETGCPLFDRLNHKIYLTPAGEAFLRKTTRLLELYDDLTATLPALARATPLRLGSSITIANIWLPALLSAWKRRCPDTPVSVRIDSAQRIEQALLSNEVDLALIEGPLHHKQLACTTYLSYEIAVVAAPGHPLAQKPLLSLSDFLSADLLLREKGSALRDTLDSALLLQGLCAEPVWVSVNSQALVEGVKAGLGVSVLPPQLIRQELAAGELVRLTVEGLRLLSPVSAAYHPSKFQPEGVQAFLDLCAQHIKEEPL